VRESLRGPAAVVAGASLTAAVEAVSRAEYVLADDRPVTHAVPTSETRTHIERRARQRREHVETAIGATASPAVRCGERYVGAASIRRRRGMGGRAGTVQCWRCGAHAHLARECAQRRRVAPAQARARRRVSRGCDEPTARPVPGTGVAVGDDSFRGGDDVAAVQGPAGEDVDSSVQRFAVGGETVGRKGVRAEQAQVTRSAHSDAHERVDRDRNASGKSNALVGNYREARRLVASIGFSETRDAARQGWRDKKDASSRSEGQQRHRQRASDEGKRSRVWKRMAIGCERSRWDDGWLAAAAAARRIPRTLPMA